VSADYTWLGDTIPSWISAIGGLVATGIAVVAFLQGRRTDKGMKQMAEVVESGQREAGRGVMGSISSTLPPSEQSAEGTSGPPQPGVIWTVTKTGKSGYIVANEGAGPANVSSYGPTDEGFVFRKETATPVVIHPGEFLTFLWIKTWQSPSVMSLRIEWTEGDPPTEQKRLIAVT
jgi:hypothetical protein